MFTYNLKENEKKDCLVYRPSISLKLLCGFFSLFLFIGFFISLSSDGWSYSYIFPLFIALLSLLIVLYQDEWIIDNKNNSFTSVWGIYPFISKKTYYYDDIKRLELTHFTKGLQNDEKPSIKHRPYCVLSIRMKESDETHQIEIMSERKSAGKIERIAVYIALYSGLAFYKDRDRIVDINPKRVF